MNKKLWGIIIFLIVLTFAFVITYNNNKVEKIDVQLERDQAKEDLVESPKTTINVKHQYNDGVHAYVGYFTTPTPCHLHEADIVYPSAEGEPYLLEVTYEANPDEMCAQVITDREFEVSFEAEESIDVIASINDEVVNLNIFEVPANQSLEEFEILNKG
ncbi:hypothetical protein GW764_00330 [Candidatus Parcubacteria bacterium]|nr:hypothetical protein [Candidatus Parcubacteria bacterium]